MFLAPSLSNSLWLLGHRGSGYSGVDVTRLAVRRELSIYFHFFLLGLPPFSKYCFHWLPVFTRHDWLSFHSQIKLMIIIFSCTSSNIVAEGIRGQATAAIAHQRRASLLVYIYATPVSQLKVYMVIITFSKICVHHWPQ